MKHRFRIPIAFKLIFLTIILLLAVAIPIAIQSANRFEKITIDREGLADLDQSKARAAEVEELLESYLDKTKMIASLLLKEQPNSPELAKALDLTFHRDKDFVCVEVISRQPHDPPLRVVNGGYLREYKLDASFIDVLREAQKTRHILEIPALFAGGDDAVQVRNSTIHGGAPLLTIGFPLAKDAYGNVTDVALAEIRLDRLQKVFAAVSARRLFLVDRNGRLLAGPDEKEVVRAESVANLPIVDAALNSPVKQGAKPFADPTTGEWFTGAYARTAIGVTAIAVAPEKIILEAAQKVRREAFYIAGRVLSLALFLVFVFSITLTAPIEKLAELATEVAKGNFKVQSHVRSRDEVGLLGESFDHMISGLIERDRVKNMFNKFHGSSVTDDLLKGDLHLGGSKKNVTVFFSDIRDFTKFSEAHTPEQVVEMLNEYFQIMVRIINSHGGVVDKFIGDAIMAIWGAPNSTEQDSENAVRACLQMRLELANLNEARVARGDVPIKIGMGLHKGDAISGTIGSEERMEYTVIGDAVNQASRIEASTKAFGADLLLSENLAEAVASSFMLEAAGSVEVKGKVEPLKLFRVRGYYDESKTPVTIQTPYSDYEPEATDKVKLAG